MKQNFDKAMAFVLKFEGGYTDGKNGASRFDHGGATNQGITDAVYNDWRIGKGLSRQPVVGLSGIERDAIYRERYWRAIRGDDLPEPVDMVMFDSAVNVGPVQAIKWLQRSVGVSADGRLGPITMAALENKPAESIAQDITDQRRDFYEYLVEKDPTQGIFLKGWCRRCDALSDAVRV